MKATINDVLKEFVSSDKDFTNFCIEDLKRGYHSRNASEPDHPDMKRYATMFQHNLSEKQLEGTGVTAKSINYLKFFNSTMDEPRQFYADEFAEFILFRSDMHDAAFFRNLITKKELAREVDYTRHRDHASHTLYNYLLGWYFYKNCAPLQQEINKKIEWLQTRTGAKIPVIDFFGNAWVNASLMHDIGYIFEGSIPSSTNSPYNERVRQGAAIVQTFFYHRFWFDSKLDSKSIRHQLTNTLNFNIEDFNEAQSFIQLGDKLATLPDVDQIQNASKTIPGLIKDKMKYFDSFEVWRTFCSKIFANPNDPETLKLEKRLEKLKDSYYERMYKGLDEAGDRIIDHGVASGLLLLLYHSYFFTIYYQLKNNQVHNSHDPAKLDAAERIDYDELRDFVLNKLPYKHYDYFPEWYFTGVLWSTLATALHNIQQDDVTKWQAEAGKQEDDWRLSINEDPLTYLGILVDLIQEWDRHRMLPFPTRLKKLPLQSDEVSLVSRNFNEVECTKAFNFEKAPYSDLIGTMPTICIVYEREEYAEKVGKTLVSSLRDSWRYVLIYSLKTYNTIFH